MMNRQEQETIKQIVLDYLEYQRKSDDKEGFLCMGDGGGLEPSSRGSGKRPDPIAVKIDRASRNEEEITQNERIARELLWLLTPCERVCVTAWESIKNAINKTTKDRYRKADVIYYLRSNGMPVDQDRYEFFKECGEAGLLIAHKKRFPDQWKVASKKSA